MHRKGSSTGHPILPAANADEELNIPLVSQPSLAAWTVGRATVIWTIWPAVVFHTIFAAIITTVSLRTRFSLALPPVLMTVLGVVIGFVISYRASSGYDRYWAGRCAWSDLIKLSRTFSRLIWFHVPLKPTQDSEKDEVAESVMREKVVALDLIEGFIIAVKHHLRGESGIYYEDLFHVLRPLHKHSNERRGREHETTNKTKMHLKTPSDGGIIRRVHSAPESSDPVIPAINQYGTFNPSRRASSTHSSNSSRSRLLFPSSGEQISVWDKMSVDLIPFASSCRAIFKIMTLSQDDKSPYGHRRGIKRHPKVAGGGENLPLEIIYRLSTWLSVLESRGTVPGTSLGGMFGCVASFEDSLGVLERILTTPLPLVYSAHIRHAVWIYLFLLPFQLVGQFGWFAIPGVGVAAFFYMGFLAAGEEIEQPFGYDPNDLDLDLFCQQIVHADLVRLRHCTSKNVLPNSHENEGKDKEHIRDVFGVIQ